MPATGGTSMSGWSWTPVGQQLELDQGCRCPEPVVTAAGAGKGLSCSHRGRSSTCPNWDARTLCVLDAATAETGASEASEAFGAASGLGPQVSAADGGR